MTIESEGIGPHLPVVFDNWPREHNPDGTHGDIHADDIEADQVYCSGLSVFGESDFYGDVDLHCHRIISPKSLGGTLGKAIIYLGPNGCYVGLQAAINDLGAAGGTVYILPGYTESTAVSIVPVPNCAIVCPSRDAVLTDGHATGLTAGIIHLNAQNHITISGIKFVGLGSGKTSIGIRPRSGGGYASSEHCLIEHCWFYDCKWGIYESYGRGLIHSIVRDCYATGYAACAFLCGYSIDVTYERCYVDSATIVNGFNTGTYDVGPLVLRDCHVWNVSGDGFYIGVTVYKNLLLDGCTAYACGQYGFSFKHPNRAPDGIRYKAVNCTASLCKKHGWCFVGSAIEVRHCHATLTNCGAVDNGTLSANTYSGFKITVNCDRVQFQNCKGANETTANQKYGIDIDAGATKTEIRSGVWASNATGAWNDNGTDTVKDAFNI